MKRFFLINICMAILVAMTAIGAFAAESITQKDIDAGLDFCREYPVGMSLDGNAISFPEKDVPPVIVKERTLIPARALFEAMGGTVTWNNETQIVGIKVGESTVNLTIGSSVAFVNGQAKTLEVPAMIIDHDKDYFGSTMIPVRFTAEALGCGVKWGDLTRMVEISSPETAIPPWIATPPGIATSPGVITPPSVVTPPAAASTDPAINWDGQRPRLPVMNAAASEKLIVIDLGHGGKDSGSIGHEKKPDQLYEKDVNLKVGIMLNQLLKEAGANIYMIRDTDIYYTLLERAAFANSKGATFFISIHNNSSDYAAPHGTEVYYYSKVNEDGQNEQTLYGIDSKTVAKAVQKSMVDAIGTYDRGIKSNPSLAVLNKTNMPAIIVEGAFMSNEENLNLIRQDDYAEKYAYAVAKALIEEFNRAYK